MNHFAIAGVAVHSPFMGSIETRKCQCVKPANNAIKINVQIHRAINAL
jgi:hypothetical protein